eukprot:TRINITY_DN15408_c0_g1_i1.p1 TRINITY_DN15408_c0_g1~~TRINITY_DN15408_c0_g1_i1.p1  ORF type:complete len:129 (+),score=19.07 TRINITY_DN15408_c0_g1_i1:36-389(+)
MAAEAQSAELQALHGLSKLQKPDESNFFFVSADKKYNGTKQEWRDAVEKLIYTSKPRTVPRSKVNQMLEELGVPQDMWGSTIFFTRGVVGNADSVYANKQDRQGCSKLSWDKYKEFE